MFLAAPSSCRIQVFPSAELRNSPLLGHVLQDKITDILEEALSSSSADSTPCHTAEDGNLYPLTFLYHPHPLQQQFFQVQCVNDQRDAQLL